MAGTALSATSERVLQLLDLFTVARPVWSVEEMAAVLRLSSATAYRYVANLTRSGLLARYANGTYRLGPTVVRLDRRLRLSDPLVTTARSEMHRLADGGPDGCVVFLAQLYDLGVMCIHQEYGARPHASISYDRGRVMPLFRGSASLVILAHLPDRHLRTLFKAEEYAINDAGLGGTLTEFKSTLAGYRAEGWCVATGQVDPGMRGVSVPLLGSGPGAIASLTMVAPSESFPRRRANALGRELARTRTRVEIALARGSSSA